ncbi:hypothetical protein CEXT_109761 [Caerostris extrusa]|uniref:Uncharacterized protein n=1 Tax=Caerostris extrusa TaxID=172846 RepID=A0AAV4QTV3_CAEEX|nr:hypothetical protein CEXT_109761 [Caerostris extrusa]
MIHIKGFDLKSGNSPAHAHSLGKAKKKKPFLLHSSTHREARFVEIRKPLRFHESASISTSRSFVNVNNTWRNTCSQNLSIRQQNYSPFARSPIPVAGPLPATMTPTPPSEWKESSRITNDSCRVERHPFFSRNESSCEPL